jgi:hypothetical protein
MALRIQYEHLHSQDTPAPSPFRMILNGIQRLRFCSVVDVALILAFLDCMLSSSGNLVGSERLYTATLAATFAWRAWIYASCEGGQAHGTLMGPLDVDVDVDFDAGIVGGER